MRVQASDTEGKMEQQSKDLDLLDLAVLVVQRARFLVGLALVGGALALGGAVLLPRVYVSQAIVQLPRGGVTFGATSAGFPTSTEGAKIMLSPLVLDAVIMKNDLGKHGGGDSARKQLIARMKVTAGVDQLLSFSVTGSSPQQAQALANDILDAWLVAGQPSQREIAELKGLYLQTQASLAVANRLVERLVAEQLAHSGKTREQEGMSLAMALDTQAHLQRQAAAIAGAMRGLTRDVVKLAPTLPSDPEGTSLGLPGLLGALLGGGLALLWIVLKDAWGRPSEVPTFAERLRSAGKRN